MVESFVPGNGPPPPVPQLTLTSSRVANVVQVVVAGEVDLATADQLRDSLLGVIEVGSGGLEIQVDLARVTFLDARGIGALLDACSAARRSRIRLTVHRPQDIVRRLLEITGVAAELSLAPRERDEAASGARPGTLADRTRQPASRIANAGA